MSITQRFSILFMFFNFQDKKYRSNNKISDNCSCETPTLELTSDKTIQHNLTGRRIIDIASFFEDLVSFKHLDLFNCKSDHLKIIDEVRIGFKSTFVIKCTCCMEQKNVASDRNPYAMDINKAAVLGTLSSGGSYSQLEEQFGYCNIPVMGRQLFFKTENELAEVIHEAAWEVIEIAGRQEKDIAIQKGHLDSDGLPYITVIADGAWSKRSYKVNYNAASGVVCLNKLSDMYVVVTENIF